MHIYAFAIEKLSKAADMPAKISFSYLINCYAPKNIDFLDL